MAFPGQPGDVFKTTSAFQLPNERQQRRLGDASSDDEIDGGIVDQLAMKTGRGSPVEDDRYVGMNFLEQRRDRGSALRVRKPMQIDPEQLRFQFAKKRLGTEPPDADHPQREIDDAHAISV